MGQWWSTAVGWDDADTTKRAVIEGLGTLPPDYGRDGQYPPFELTEIALGAPIPIRLMGDRLVLHPDGADLAFVRAS